MVNLNAYIEAMKQLPEGAAEAEVNAEIHEMTSVTVQGGELIQAEVSQQSALYVRVSGEKTGYVYTQDLGEDAVQVLQRAYENSFASDREKPEEMNRSCEHRDYGNLCAETSVPVLKEQADRMELELTDLFEQLRVMDQEKTSGQTEEPGEIQLEVSLQAETFGQHTVNSHGLDVNSLRPLYILSIDAGSTDGTQGLSASVTVSAKELTGFSMQELAENLWQRLNWQRKAEHTFSSGRYDVIFSEEAVYNLFATAWQEFSACKYTEGTSALTGMLGTQVGADCLSITDYAETSGSGFSMVCDCEGSKGVEVSLMKHGIMTGLLHNVTTAQQLGQNTTGNAGRRPLMFGNIATDILVTPKNFCIEPGKASLTELEEHLGEGVLITEYFDLFHTLDIASGDFSAPCYGVMIRNGKEAEHLTALTVTGNIRELLANVQEAGSHRMIRPMTALQNYGIGTCALRISGLYVSGE